MTLLELPLYSTAIVKELHCSGITKRRLLDLGMIPGTEIVPVLKSPSGDPTAFEIRKTIIALRKEDCELVELQRIIHTLLRNSIFYFEVIRMGLTASSTGSSLLTKELQTLQQECDYTVAFAGNPNVGKSTIFNNLTGLHQHTGNWPGKTVSNASGICRYQNQSMLLVDLPGTYSLRFHSQEEEIARNYICSGNPHVTVVVVDATSLERNLNLVFQVMEITENTIVCVNLLDEAKKKNIEIDLKKLSTLLGVPVVGTTARKKKTLTQLLHTIHQVCSGEITCSPHRISFSTDEEEEMVSTIMQKSAEITTQVCTYHNKDYRLKNQKIDEIVTSKLFGIPIMLVFLGLLFWITIVGANYPSQMLSSFFTMIQEKLLLMFHWMHVPNIITELLINGMYKTLAWVIAVMLPPMAIFFPLFTLLEDLGYLPRISFNLDNYFKKAGTSGKQALTMCMGFGCNACGVVGTRIIDSPRERLIAMITNAFVPCNGRFPLLITIASIFIGSYFVGMTASLISTLCVLLVVLLGIFLTLLVSKILSKTVLKGVPSSFMLELPPYRRPQIGKVLVRSLLDRTLFVLGRAISVAAPVGIVIWLLANLHVGDISILSYVAGFLDPFAKCMGMDGYILTAFLLGIPANEIVLPIILMSYLASGNLVDMENTFAIGEILKQDGWTLLTAMNVMIFTLLHFPCGTTLLSIKKECGSTKWTLLAFALPTVCGMLICFITTGIWHLL